MNGNKSGKVYAAPFYWGGMNGTGTAGFDTSTLADGDYILSMTYTDSTGDHTAEINFKVKNAGSVQPKISGISDGTTVSGIIQITPDASTFEIIQKAEYFVDGVSKGVSMTAPFTWGGSQGFDTKTLTNAQHALTAVITDNKGPHSINLNFTVNNPATSNPGRDFTGITEGAILNGTVNVGPNLSTHSDIRKVFYYLNGTQSGKYYEAPFTLGGAAGFDTKTLANGNYTLAMSYTDGTGEHTSTVTFSVNNSATPPEPPAPGNNDFTGISEGAVVQGIVNAGPNLTTHPGIRKISYYLNGTQSGKYYAAPFTWGGVNGYDSKTLVNGDYALSMTYTDNTGDHTVTVNFKVSNP